MTDSRTLSCNFATQGQRRTLHEHKHLRIHRRAGEQRSCKILIHPRTIACHTFTIHIGAFCLHPNIRSVRIMPVFASTERSSTSTVTTWEQWGFGYLCHIPTITCAHGKLYKVREYKVHRKLVERHTYNYRIENNNASWQFVKGGR